MIDNQGDRVFAPGGIAQAQLVYEILTEYNITRYMAVFWDTLPEMVDWKKLAPLFSGLCSWSTMQYILMRGQHYAYRDIPKLKIQNIDYQVHSSAFWDPTKDINNWQDSYTSRERIENLVSDKNTVKNLRYPSIFHHDEFIVPDGTDATDVFIQFSSGNDSTCGYIYDENEKVYLRSRIGKVHIDRNTEEQIKTTNIIVLKISSPLIEGDAYGRRNLLNIGKGEGYYITGGKAIPIEWSKSARDAQTQYTTENGKPLVLNRGQTWIEVVPKLEYLTMK